MATKIRLKRFGKKRAPFYRVVVADERAKRDGRVIEEVGKYHPTEEPSVIDLESERIQYWLGVGAQPTPAVAALLKLTGDWQRFKGRETGTDAEARIQAAADEAERLNAAAAEAASKAKAETASEPAEDAQA